jgi:hypothetical protein
MRNHTNQLLEQLSPACRGYRTRWTDVTATGGRQVRRFVQSSFYNSDLEQIDRFIRQTLFRFLMGRNKMDAALARVAVTWGGG